MDNRIASRIFCRLDAWPLLSVFLLRTLFQIMPVLNDMLALSGVRYRNYRVGTLLGLPLPIRLYALIFDYAAMPLGRH